MCGVFFFKTRIPTPNISQFYKSVTWLFWKWNNSPQHHKQQIYFRNVHEIFFLLIICPRKKISKDNILKPTSVTYSKEWQKSVLVYLFNYYLFQLYWGLFFFHYLAKSQNWTKHTKTHKKPHKLPPKTPPTLDKYITNSSPKKNSAAWQFEFSVEDYLRATCN